jgi:hypothetical protein
MNPVQLLKGLRPTAATVNLLVVISRTQPVKTVKISRAVNWIRSARVRVATDPLKKAISTTRTGSA